MKSLVSKIISGFCLLFLTCLSTAGQSFIQHPMAEVEAMLRNEKIHYHIDLHETGVMIVADEMTDTVVWRFDANNICYEYQLFISPAQYFEMCNLMQMHNQKISEDVYLNVPDKTVTYIQLEAGRLILTTRLFNYNSPAPPIFWEHPD